MTKKLEKQKKELMTYLHKLNFHFMREGYGYGKKILDFVLKSAQIQVEKKLENLFNGQYIVNPTPEEANPIQDLPTEAEGYFHYLTIGNEVIEKYYDTNEIAMKVEVGCCF